MSFSTGHIDKSFSSRLYIPRSGVAASKDGIPIMGNFMWQLGWDKGCPESWQNTVSGCVHQSASRRGEHLTLSAEERGRSSLVQVGTT